jgi:hypothetical protein
MRPFLLLLVLALFTASCGSHCVASRTPHCGSGSMLESVASEVGRALSPSTAVLCGDDEGSGDDTNTDRGVIERKRNCVESRPTCNPGDPGGCPQDSAAR